MSPQPDRCPSCGHPLPADAPLEHRVTRADEQAQEMAAQADRLLAEDAPEAHWHVRYALVPSPPGTLRLAAYGDGYPCGTVPLHFQIAWWQAVMDAAWQQITGLRQAHGQPARSSPSGP